MRIPRFFFLKSKSPPCWGHLLIASCDEYFAHFLGSRSRWKSTVHLACFSDWHWQRTFFLVGRQFLVCGNGTCIKKSIHRFILQLAVAQVHHLYPQSATFEHYDNSTVSTKTLQFYPTILHPFNKFQKSHPFDVAVPTLRLLRFQASCFFTWTFAPLFSRTCNQNARHMHMWWIHQTAASVAELMLFFQIGSSLVT